MPPKKKKEVSFTPDPFIRDAAGNPIGTRNLPEAEAAEVRRQSGSPTTTGTGAPEALPEASALQKARVSKGKIISAGGSEFIVSDPRDLNAINERRARKGLPPVQEAPSQLRNQAEQELIGGAQLIQGQLQEDIVSQPSLEPEGLPFIATREEAEAIAKEKREFLGRLITGKASKKEIIEEAKKFATGAAIVGTAIAVVLASPTLAAFFGRTAAAKIFGTGTLKTAAAGVSAYFIGRNVLDYKGEELDNMRSILSQYTEDGEKIEALANQGAPVDVELRILSTYVDEINFAEQKIKEIGRNNIQFQYSKEWIQDMGDIRTARLAVLRRIDSITNKIEIQGIEINPEGIVLEVANGG